MRQKSRFSQGYLAALFAALLTLAPGLPAQAETIRLAREYGIAYLPLIVMRSQHLLEKIGHKQDVPIETEWLQFTGGAAMNESLIAGRLDIASGGVTPMIVLWARTRTNLHVHGIAALTTMPLYLNTIDPDVHSIRDFTDNDRIAMPAAGISLQAITLMIAASETFGPNEAKKLNPLCVSMSHPDGMAALLARKAGITAHFTAPPYMYEELQHKGVHRVLDSYSVLGGPATFTLTWASERFAKENPKNLPIFVAALRQADTFIHAHPRRAAELYVASTHTKIPPAELVKMITNQQVHWTTQPRQTMKYARFMAKLGMIPAAPANWKEMFFPEIADRPGS